MQNKYKIKYILSSLAILVVPQFALLSTTQPKGQMPILEPLQPASKDIKPNISTNIQQTDSSAKPQPVNNIDESESKELGQSAIEKNKNVEKKSLEVKKSESFTWLWIILIAGLLGLGSWFFWKKNV